MHICYLLNMINISYHNYLNTLVHPSLVSYFKCESNFGLVPSLVTPRSLIYVHVQPDIPDNAILVGWAVSIFSSIRRILVVVDIYAPLDLHPPFMLNKEFV